MELNCELQQQEFEALVREKISRAGIEKLMDWLKKSDFFTAPASTRYHGAYAGGLCQHSMDVYNYALRVQTLYDGETPIDPESVAIASLFHDVCKVNFYVETLRNQKVDGKWVQVPSYTIEEKFPFGGHGSKSVFILQQFLKLKPEEAVAVNCHMGYSEGQSTATLSLSNAYLKYPLAWMIHAADEAASYLLERQ